MSKTDSNRQRQADTRPTEVPKFDLAKELMAEQRKISTIRRTGPGRSQRQSAKQQPPAIGYAIGPPPIIPDAQQIITEIVARDIQDLKSEI